LISLSAMNSEHDLEQIADIYAAMGDVERWQAIEEHFASGPRLSEEVRNHIQIARRVHERMADLEAHRVVLAGVYERVGRAALIVDAERRVYEANAAARRLLDSGNGLTIVSDRLRVVDGEEDAALTCTIGRVTAGDDGARDLGTSLVSVSRPGRRPLSLLVVGCRHRAPMFFDAPRVVLLVFDPDDPSRPDATLLGRLFDLTPREADLAVLLMQGLSVDEAARSLGIALSTARTLLKRVSAKTDTHSQAELLRLLLAAPLPSA
jgi:DNA-binding CsgD family transcriptional regulator